VARRYHVNNILHYPLLVSAYCIFFTGVFNRGHHKHHSVLWASLLFLQITPADIYPVISACNTFNFPRSIQIISTMLHDLRTEAVLTAWSRVILEKLTGSQLVKKFVLRYGTRRFITAFTKASHLSLYWRVFRLQNPQFPQLIKPSPTFHGNTKFIALFNWARHLSLSWAGWTQST
jgi:hypothetical protein